MARQTVWFSNFSFDISSATWVLKKNYESNILLNRHRVSDPSKTKETFAFSLCRKDHCVRKDSLLTQKYCWHGLLLQCNWVLEWEIYTISLSRNEGYHRHFINTYVVKNLDSRVIRLQGASEMQLKIRYDDEKW